ncbi:DUF4249 family protein [Hymenobacter sp. B81]|uniref:DUF4249 family protein n=1 Tax=Hymenobacter sp. B81 TaxID=3344878 RepID=UPI0037DDBD87
MPLLAGCETTIDVPEPAHTPSVALLLTLDNLDPNEALRRASFVGRTPFVSVSQRGYDTRRLEGNDQAVIEVRDEVDQLVERYRPVVPTPGAPPSFQKGRYQPTQRYRFEPGRTYAVRVTVPDMVPAESRLTLPTLVPVQISVMPLSSTGDQSRLRVTVAFDDPAAEGDYYLATARLVNAQGEPIGSLQPVPDENGLNLPTFRISGLGTSSLNAFSDANVNGQRVSYSDDLQYSLGSVGNQVAYLEVTLSHITRDLYLFYTSYRRYSNSNGNPFSEPSPLYSNVTAGFGIFGGSTDASAQLRL